MGCGLLSRKTQLLGRIEDVKKTAKTLVAADGLIRIFTGAEPDYKPNKEVLDYARSSLSPQGGVIGSKPINFNFRTPANTRDTIPLLADLDVESIVWQTGIGDGNTLRVTFNGTPDLSGIVAGMYLTLHNSGTSALDGTFLITTVNDGSDYVDIINRNITSGASDIASSSTALGNILYPLEFQWALIACGCSVQGIARIPIGAVTSGPFTRNETITGGTSSGTGRVLFSVANGDAYIYYMPISGNLQTTEVITGGTSGATATSSSAPSIRGHRVGPISGNNCTHEAATVQLNNDGYLWKGRSAMGNMSFEAAANKPMYMDFNMQAAFVSAGDATMLSLTQDDEQPPIVNQAGLFLDSFNPVFSNVAFDMVNSVSMRENGNAPDSSGYESARETARVPKLTLTLEHELAATYDFFEKLNTGAKVAHGFHVGTVADKRIFFFADYLEFDELPKSENDGISTLTLSATCTSPNADGDDEWEMLFV